MRETPAVEPGAAAPVLLLMVVAAAAGTEEVCCKAADEGDAAGRTLGKACDPPSASMKDCARAAWRGAGRGDCNTLRPSTEENTASTSTGLSITPEVLREASDADLQRGTGSGRATDVG